MRRAVDCSACVSFHLLRDRSLSRVRSDRDAAEMETTDDGIRTSLQSVRIAGLVDFYRAGRFK